MADQKTDAAAAPARQPDYDLGDTLELVDPNQYGALFEPTRGEIASILLERAATTSELAQVLGKPKGTVGHHLKVMVDAGLVRVVRTKQVRALEAKYYGRTARVFLYRREHDALGHEERVLTKAAAEIAQSPGAGPQVSANIRYLRIPDERALEWRNRLEQLMIEFADQPVGGSTTYALAYGFYATNRAALPDDPALADDAAPAAETAQP